VTAPELDVLPGLRAAILAAPAITSKLGVYNGAPSVHTRRPVASDAPYPMVVISKVTRTDNDGISDFRPLQVVDINTYGPQPEAFRDIEKVAELIYVLFHRQSNIVVPGYSVTDIRCKGPSPAPVDDETKVGRRVTLTIRLFAK
jgi:hypothetical protein